MNTSFGKNICKNGSNFAQRKTLKGAAIVGGNSRRPISVMATLAARPVGKFSDIRIPSSSMNSESWLKSNDHANLQVLSSPHMMDSWRTLIPR